MRLTSLPEGLSRLNLLEALMKELSISDVHIKYVICLLCTKEPFGVDD